MTRDVEEGGDSQQGCYADRGERPVDKRLHLLRLVFLYMTVLGVWTSGAEDNSPESLTEPSNYVPVVCTPLALTLLFRYLDSCVESQQLKNTVRNNEAQALMALSSLFFANLQLVFDAADVDIGKTVPSILCLHLAAIFSMRIYVLSSMNYPVSVEQVDKFIGEKNNPPHPLSYPLTGASISNHRAYVYAMLLLVSSYTLLQHPDGEALFARLEPKDWVMLCLVATNLLGREQAIKETFLAGLRWCNGGTENEDEIYATYATGDLSA